MKRLKKCSEENKVAIVVSYIRHYRNLKNMTQKDVAERLGITPQRFASIETNKHITNIIKLLEISEILEVKVDELYKVEYVDVDTYNQHKVKNLDLIECDELKEAYTKQEQLISKENINDDELKELKKIEEIIRKKSILRYGNVLESFVWEKIVS